MPAAPTAFNGARSHNKLLDAACLGAVPLLSEGHPLLALVPEPQRARLAVRPGGWEAAIGSLDASAERPGALALARKLDGGPALRAMWSDALGLP